MPWHVSKSTRCPSSKPWAVIKESDNTVTACHVTEAGAKRQLAALYANEPGGTASMSTTDDETRRTFTADQRKNAAKKGAAMPDGSYPIENVSDLKNAIQAFGRAKNPAAVKAHIKKRARALGATHLLPEDWQQQHSETPPRGELVRAVMDWQQKHSETPPRDELVRAVMDGGVEFRDASEDRDGRLGTLTGHFAVFNRWTEINSAFEGRFMEQIAPGSFTKAFNEARGGMRVLFQHGKDPQIGDKPLGPISDLREDATGAYYEVPLLDTSYNRDLLPGLEAGLYGASFRFRVMREGLVKKPSVSATNVDGIPERTVKEVSVKEFGPVTFPAYSDATAGVRSMTDEFIFASLVRDPDVLRRLVEYIPTEVDEDDASDDVGYTDTLDAPPEPRRASSAPSSGRRVSIGKPLYGVQRRRQPSWLLPR